MPVTGIEVNKKLENRNTYIYVELTGRVRNGNSSQVEKASRLALEAINMADEAGINKIFCNAEHLNVKISLLDRFTFGVFLAGKNMERMLTRKQSLKVAFFANPALIDPGKIGATVARNRGLDVIVTSDKQEALNWLGVEDNNQV